MVLDDIGKACLVSNGITGEDFDVIYYNSNESLKELFQCFSVKDKDVLTVLASSDQLFYTYYHGARSVDSFDVNLLTKYYYYLRKWRILYEDKFYLSRKMFHSHSYVYELLNKVEVHKKEEEDAVFFWKNYLNQVSPSLHEKLYSIDRHQNEIKDLKKLKEQLLKREFSFYSLDLFRECSFSKKYDVIIISNILEYAQNYEKLKRTYQNLNTLLRPGGQVIGSYIAYCPLYDKVFQEREAFENDFEYSVFSKITNPFLKSSESIGYSYTKK